MNGKYDAFGVGAIAGLVGLSDEERHIAASKAFEQQAADKLEALRDQFAGQAMGALVTGYSTSSDNYINEDDTAVAAYSFADAMLEARGPKIDTHVPESVK